MAEQDQVVDQSQNEPFKVPPVPELSALKTDLNLPVYDYQRVAKEKSPESIRAEQAKTQEQLAKLSTDIEQNKLLKEQYEASAEANIQRQAREKRNAIYAKEQELKAKYPYPEFHPTQENINDLALMFGGISFLGTAIGGTGKMSAMNAMKSMTGMLQGWREGREDLYKREKENFEVEFKRVREILSDVKQDADKALERMAYDLEEAQALAKQSAAKLGSQVANQILEKQGLENYVKFVNETYNTAFELDKRKEDLSIKKAQLSISATELVVGSDGNVYPVDIRNPRKSLPEGVFIRSKFGGGAKDEREEYLKSVFAQKSQDYRSILSATAKPNSPDVQKAKQEMDAAQKEFNDYVTNKAVTINSSITGVQNPPKEKQRKTKEEIQKAYQDKIITYEEAEKELKDIGAI